MVIIFAMTFMIQFVLEGVYKTTLVLPMACFGLLAAVFTVAFSSSLPFTFQRALAFLPVKVDPVARLEAQGSTEWRVKIWKAMLPQIPRYLLLGKGYALAREDYGFMFTHRESSSLTEDWDATVAGNYHNGPLDLVLTFGIWGVIAFGWFLVAAMRVLTANYRYSPPALQTINTFLLAAFIAKTILFLIVFGGLHSDMLTFAGYVGLSLSLNGGVCRLSPAAVSKAESTAGMRSLLPRPRASFQH